MTPVFARKYCDDAMRGAFPEDTRCDMMLEAEEEKFLALVRGRVETGSRLIKDGWI